MNLTNSSRIFTKKKYVGMHKFTSHLLSNIRKHFIKDFHECKYIKKKHHKNIAERNIYNNNIKLIKSHTRA